MTENAFKIMQTIENSYVNDQLTDDDLVDVADLAFKLLGLVSVSDAAKLEKKTYAGIKKYSKNLVKISTFTFYKSNQ